MCTIAYSVALIIGSAIGVGHCLAYRQFILTLPTDIWYLSMNFYYELMLVIFFRISIINVPKVYTSLHI